MKSDGIEVKIVELDNLHFGGPLGVTVTVLTASTILTLHCYIGHAALRLSTPYDYTLDLLFDIHRPFLYAYDCIGRRYLREDSATLGIKSGSRPRARLQCSRRRRGKFPPLNSS